MSQTTHVHSDDCKLQSNRNGRNSKHAPSTFSPRFNGDQKFAHSKHVHYTVQRGLDIMRWKSSLTKRSVDFGWILQSYTERQLSNNRSAKHRRRQSGEFPASSLIFAFTSPIVSEAWTSRVIVWPVKWYFTKICNLSHATRVSDGLEPQWLIRDPSTD